MHMINSIIIPATHRATMYNCNNCRTLPFISWCIQAAKYELQQR